MIAVLGEGPGEGCFLGVFSTMDKAREAMEKRDGPITDTALGPIGKFYDWYTKEIQVNIPLDCRG